MEHQLKNRINKNTLVQIINEMTLSSNFSTATFRSSIRGYEKLELKERARVIAIALYKAFNSSYLVGASQLKIALGNTKLKGLELLVYSEYISQFGREHVKISFDLMELLTKVFTAEFAVRPFLDQDLEFCLEKFIKYSLSKNLHLRRFSSEGSRPYLPWGGTQKIIEEKPFLTLKILENLKFDDELYVRKSVANHLNDISKKHPDLVLEILNDWLKKADENNRTKVLWIANKALRTLVKNGNSKALRFFEVRDISNQVKVKFKISDVQIQVGQKLLMEADISCDCRETEKLIIDYRILFLNRKNEFSGKVFKGIKTSVSKGNKVLFNKSHSFKEISTRKYYKGKHKVELIINGIVVAVKGFELDI